MIGLKLGVNPGLPNDTIRYCKCIRQNFNIFDFELNADNMAKIAAINTETIVYADHHKTHKIETLADYA